MDLQRADGARGGSGQHSGDQGAGLANRQDTIPQKLGRVSATSMALVSATREARAKPKTRKDAA